MLIYVAGPLGINNNKEKIKDNITDTIRIARIIMDIGHTPFIPHLFWYAQEYHYICKSEKQMFEYFYRVIKHCDALLRMPGQSSGADEEVKFAIANKVPVYEIKGEDFIETEISFALTTLSILTKQK